MSSSLVPCQCLVVVRHLPILTSLPGPYPTSWPWITTTTLAPSIHLEFVYFLSSFSWTPFLLRFRTRLFSVRYKSSILKFKDILRYGSFYLFPLFYTQTYVTPPGPDYTYRWLSTWITHGRISLQKLNRECFWFRFHRGLSCLKSIRRGSVYRLQNTPDECLEQTKRYMVDRRYHILDHLQVLILSLSYEHLFHLSVSINFRPWFYLTFA